MLRKRTGLNYSFAVGRVAQSVQRLATGWTVRGSNPGGVEIVRTCPDRPWSPPRLLYNGYRCVTLVPHPRLVPWSRKSRAIPLLPLWTVRPVQSPSACTRVHFIFTTLPYSCAESMRSHRKQDKVHVQMYIMYARMSAFCHIDFYDVGVAGVTLKRHDMHTDFIAL